MAEFKLTESPIASGNLSKAEGIHISECPSYSLFSIAPFKGQTDKISNLLETEFGLSLPKPGEISISDHACIFSLSRDQWLLQHKNQETILEPKFETKFAGLAAITDQSDSWITYQLSGQNIQSMLERICPIDLHENAFPVGTTVRTSMEHISVLLIRTENSSQGHSTYQLMTAPSFRNSLLHILL